MSTPLLLLTLFAILLLAGVAVAAALMLTASDAGTTPTPTIITSAVVLAVAGLMTLSIPMAAYRLAVEVQYTDAGSSLVVILTIFDSMLFLALWVWRAAWRSSLIERHLQPQARFRSRRNDDTLIHARIGD